MSDADLEGVIVDDHVISTLGGDFGNGLTRPALPRG